jgi:hypothetical protein
MERWAVVCRMACEVRLAFILWHYLYGSGLHALKCLSQERVFGGQLPYLPQYKVQLISFYVVTTAKYFHIYVGFEVLTAVVMKSTIFCDITPCNPFSVNRRFRGTYRLHLQDRKNKLSKKPAWKQVASTWRWYVPPKRRLTLNRQHSIISQKMVLFILKHV